MIELPEAATIAAQAADALTGRTVVSAVAGASPHKFGWFGGDPATYGERYTGCRIEGASAWGGLVEVYSDGPTLLFQDGPNPRLLPPGTPPPARHQLLVELDDGSHLVCVVAMYGGMVLVAPDDPPDEYVLAARTAPSPLGPEFSDEHWDTLLAGDEKLNVKALLATKQRIPGLGNGVLQDICWTAEVDPRRKVGSLSDDERAGLLAAVRGVLAEMTRLGGRSTEKDLHGNPGGYAVVMQRAALDRPCPRCGGTVTKQALLGGAVYVCGGCQR